MRLIFIYKTLIFTLKCNACYAVLRIFQPQHVLSHHYVGLLLFVVVRVYHAFHAAHCFLEPPFTFFHRRCCLAGEAQSASFLEFSPFFRLCDFEITHCGPTATPKERFGVGCLPQFYCATSKTFYCVFREENRAPFFRRGCVNSPSSSQRATRVWRVYDTAL